MIKQSGATLPIALILLFVTTLLAVSTIQTTQMQEKMSANLQDKEISFMAAESALAAGEAWLIGLATLPTPAPSCQSFPCVMDRIDNSDFANASDTWWQANSAAYSTSLSNVYTAPRYLIEFIQFVPDSPVIGQSSGQIPGVYYYQVTAKGTGSTNEAETVLQTTVARRF
ncbi:PilX N-terminal domain-containing pilus assembly protein [Legionella sp. W05-934-2]|jgi:type IV pilus assembly protein PilX|uniref:pilus assembly PilX family protein n=1 Tax=Legionella sp. W05-934-2 TaxID=1198649 RepID=UPI003461A629